MKLNASTKERGTRSTGLSLISVRYWICRNRVRLPLFGSSRCSDRHRHRHSSDAQQVAGGHGELELVIDSLQATKHGLANAANGLAPPEVLLDAFADDLTQVITGMPGGAAVDRAATTPGVVAGDMRCYFPLTAPSDEVGAVIGFVGADAATTGIRQGIKHGQRRASLPETIRRRDHSADHQAAAILHEHMALITEHRRRVMTLTKGARVGVGRTCVGVVATGLTFPVGLRVAPAATRSLIIAAILRSKALLARPRLNQRTVDREVLPRQ